MVLWRNISIYKRDLLPQVPWKVFFLFMWLCILCWRHRVVGFSLSPLLDHLKTELSLAINTCRHYIIVWYMKEMMTFGSTTFEWIHEVRLVWVFKRILCPVEVWWTRWWDWFVWQHVSEIVCCARLLYRCSTFQSTRSTKQLSLWRTQQQLILA